MANPLISQGVLNRLLGSVLIPGKPALNITASYLGEEAIGLRMTGPITTRIGTLTGTVPSPEPYAPVVITVSLLRTQTLADDWKRQMEGNALIGDLTVRPDAATLSPYAISNASIDNVGDVSFNGRSPIYGVEIGGYWLVNQDLWT